MAIRLRVVDGKIIAICAARSVPKEGDVYIDDAQHGALFDKFERDYQEMFNCCEMPSAKNNLELVEQEESNNKNRTWWDSVFGKENNG